jgi:hypothetical protein
MGTELHGSKWQEPILETYLLARNSSNRAGNDFVAALSNFKVRIKVIYEYQKRYKSINNALIVTAR